jgi:transposase
MITQEGWMEIRILARQGKGIREIARMTRLSRNTIRRYLRSSAWPGYKKRPVRPSKLDPFRKYLEERLEAAKPHRLPASVLYREITALGFDGCERVVRNFVRILHPQPASETPVRFETDPGQQMQVDWCVFRRGANPLSAFVATLGFSRVSYVEFVTSECFEILRHCHEQAFVYFGGVPQEVLYDNMRTVVQQRNAHGEGRHRFHPGLWDMARHFGFRPRLCQPYRAQTKGKVERFNRYLRNSFFYPLQSRLKQAGLVLDAATANTEVRRWLDEVANCRMHRGLDERPVDRLAKDSEALLPLPGRLEVQPSREAALEVAPWPRTPLQRSPLVYEQLLQEGGL